MDRRGLVVLSVVAVVVVVLSVFLVGGLVTPLGGGSGRLVAVTWGLLGEIVYRLGGGEIEVVQLLPPGAEIHDWEPTAETVKAVSQSRIVFWTLEGLDDWAVKVASSAGVRDFEAGRGVYLIGLVEHEGQGHGTGYDVHFWLNPLNVKVLVENIEQQLSLEFPELAQTVRRNADELLSELDRLNEDFSQGLAPYRGRVFITQHDAFRYLAEAYGLRVEAILGPEEEEPSAARFQEIVQALKGVCAIYAEDGFIHPLAESLSREYEVRVLMLYTGEGLTLEDVKNGKGYVYLMRLNLEALLDGFRCG